MTPSARFHLAVALDGAGWHPAAWRDDTARPADLFSAQYWVDLAREAERGSIDFVTLEDSMGIQSMHRTADDDRVDQVRGRLDAVLIAARIAPATSTIGIVPTTTTTHTEPFHISKAVATLDHVSLGRGGMRVQVSATDREARLFGRRVVGEPVPTRPIGPAGPDTVEDLFEEAADFVEVVRRLWDSWEDDAEIRDVATGRFIDRDRLHYIDFTGRWFSVKGPSITPRSPQGQPIVAALAHVPLAFRLAARSADVVFTTPKDGEDARAIVAAIRSHEDVVGRQGPPLRIFADLVVFLESDAGLAMARRASLDELDGRRYRSDASIFVGTPAALVDLLMDWHSAGVEGFRLRPAVLPRDLIAVTREVVGLLPHRADVDHWGDRPTLRARLGLPRPQNRYAHA